MSNEKKRKYKISYIILIVVIFTIISIYRSNIFSGKPKLEIVTCTGYAKKDDSYQHWVFKIEYGVVTEVSFNGEKLTKAQANTYNYDDIKNHLKHDFEKSMNGTCVFETHK